jgi:hypothetical protein
MSTESSTGPLKEARHAPITLPVNATGVHSQTLSDALLLSRLRGERIACPIIGRLASSELAGYGVRLGLSAFVEDREKPGRLIFFPLEKKIRQTERQNK